MKNYVSWWEIGSKDLPTTVNFLNDLFDWDIQPGTLGGNEYWTKHLEKFPNGFAGGGVYPLGDDCEPYLTVYISVEDVDATAQLVTENGGTIVEPPFDAEGVGRICYFKEPNGQLMAMIQRKF